jgi:ATP-dependent Zn protease
MEKHHKFSIRYVVLGVWVVLVLYSYLAASLAVRTIRMEAPGEYSDSTAELIDHEVRNILNEQYEKALEILKGQKDVLTKVAQILLDKEKIEGGELKALMVKSPENPSA